MENAEEGEGELLRQTISTTDIQLIELSRGVLNFSNMLFDGHLSST